DPKQRSVRSRNPMESTGGVMQSYRSVVAGAIAAAMLVACGGGNPDQAADAAAPQQAPAPAAVASTPQSASTVIAGMAASQVAVDHAVALLAQTRSQR